MTPSISTANLILRPLKKGTVQQVRWLRDPDVVMYSDQRHGTHNLATQLDYVRSFGGRSHIWGIHTLAGDHIGNLTARNDEPNNVTDIGIMIGETTHWGKGLGYEAWSAVCKWLLDHGGVRKLEAGCMKSNVGMVRIISKSGFSLEGERANHYVGANGGPVGMVLYGRSK